MYEGTVQPTQQRCTACGNPTSPRVDRSHDRFAKETTVEATWVCMRCGHGFASGVIERIPDNQNG